MRKPTDQQIRDAFEWFDDGDASTERVIQMVCDHFDNVIDHGDVAAALDPPRPGGGGTQRGGLTGQLYAGTVPGPNERCEMLVRIDKVCVLQERKRQVVGARGLQMVAEMVPVPGKYRRSYVNPEHVISVDLSEDGKMSVLSMISGQSMVDMPVADLVDLINGKAAL